MEYAKKVPSEGEHPIYLYTSDNTCAQVISHDEAEGSQGWSEPRDESALSSTSDEQLPEPRPAVDEIGCSPDTKPPVVSKYKEINNRAVRQTRHLLGSDLVHSVQNPSNGARDQSDEGPESFEMSESGSNSISSSSSDDSDLDGNPQVGLVGQQFQEGDGPIPDFDEDSDLDAIVTRQTIILYYREDI
jgi:hypothetical protein